MERVSTVWCVLVWFATAGAAVTACCAYDRSEHPIDTDDDDIVDGASDDDSGGGIASIVDTEPEDGENSAYYRNDVIVEFDVSAPDAVVVLSEDGVGDVPGVNTLSDEARTLTFDPYGDATYDHMTAGGSFTATISWQGQLAQIHFSTWSEGPDWGGCYGLEGRDYFVDLGSATFTEPPGIGSLLSQYIADVYPIVHVAELDDAQGWIDLLMSVCLRDGSDYVQDLCVTTQALDGATLDCPYFEATFDELVFDLEDGECALRDMTLAGSFSTDGSAIDGGTLAGELDARCLDALVDPDADEGAACELVASLGIECIECTDGSGPFCLHVDAYGIYSEQVDVLGFDPETGEEFEGLTEVTDEMVADWEAVGICP